MSTDYQIVCDSCKVSAHLGQRYASGRTSFGYGEQDNEGRLDIGNFLTEHIGHGPMRVVLDEPDGYRRLWPEDLRSACQKAQGD